MKVLKFEERFRRPALGLDSGLGILLMGLFLALIGTAQGQGQEQRKARQSWGYALAGVGSLFEPGCCGEGMLHFGGGGETALLGGFGPTLELGYLSTFHGWGLGAFSPGAFYAFNRDRDTVPFVTGGYTLFFRSGLAHGLFFGGGVNHWIGDGWGIRIEGRDHFVVPDELHLLEARFGFVFR